MVVWVVGRCKCDEGSREGGKEENPRSFRTE